MSANPSVLTAQY